MRFDKNTEIDYIKGRSSGLNYANTKSTSEDSMVKDFQDSLRAESIFCRLSAWESQKDIPVVFASKDEAEETEKFEALVSKLQNETPQDDIVDLSGGEGYTQVYLVMSPSASVPPITNSDGEEYLFPREALFRFGSWVYSGQVCTDPSLPSFLCTPP